MKTDVSEFLRFLARFIATIFLVTQDGKVTVKDVGYLARLLPVIRPAFDDLPAVWDGFRSLTDEDRDTLTHLVADEMDIDLTPNTRAICMKAIYISTDLIDLITSLKDVKTAAA
ncbi:MAG: hypothetical protein U0X91_30780 [Spirosomataceae bacterium]